MRSDRKFYLTEFKLLQHESLLMTVWQDTKVVSALVTNSQPLEITQVERKQQNVEKKTSKLSSANRQLQPKKGC